MVCVFAVFVYLDFQDFNKSDVLLDRDVPADHFMTQEEMLAELEFIYHNGYEHHVNDYRAHLDRVDNLNHRLMIEGV